MSERDPNYVCALSGLQALKEEVVHDAEDDDELEELPIGWVQITFSRRGVNPAFLRLQRAKRLLREASLAAQTEPPPEVVELVEAQVDAQFAALESDTPRYVTVEDEVIVHNPDTMPEDVKAAWNSLLESLGLTEIGGNES